MAVSIEMYRCRIGQFQSNKYTVRPQHRKKSYRKVRSSKLISKIIRAAFLITLTLLSSTCPSSTSPLPLAGHPCSSLISSNILPQPGHGHQVLQVQPSHSAQFLLQQPGHCHQVPPPQPGHADDYVPLQQPGHSHQAPQPQPGHADHHVLLPQPGHSEQVLPPTPKNHNFLARYKFGNRNQKKGGINIIHWNKGSSLLSNKMGDLEAIIDNHKPLVLGISEANLRKFDDLDAVQLPEYYLHICPTIDNPDHGVSRVVVYTHKSLIVKPRPDLMNPWLSAVWLEVGLPRCKKFLLCNAYREWGYPNQQDKVSHTISAQKERGRCSWTNVRREYKRVRR